MKSAYFTTMCKARDYRASEQYQHQKTVFIQNNEVYI